MSLWTRPRRFLPGAGGAPADPADALETAADLVAAGHPVALDPGSVAVDRLAALVDAVAAAGLARDCRLVVPVGRLTDDAAAALTDRALAAGVGADLAGPLDRVRALLAGAPAAGAVVPAPAPGAEETCRALAGGRVRLLGRRSRAAGADLSFVRCLNVLMASGGHTGVGTSDPRLLAIAGERAAWNQRDPETWEYVMEQGVRVDEQRRLLAGGHTVRVTLRCGRAR